MRQLGLALACLVGVTPIAAAAAPDVPVRSAPMTSTVAPLHRAPAARPESPAGGVRQGSHGRLRRRSRASIWPHDAYAERISGRVILTCNVDRYGLAESCRGCGGDAAEQRLRPGGARDAPFAEAAATRRRRPADAVENIAIDFNAPEATVDFAGPPVAKGNTMGASSTSADIDTSTGNFSAIANRLPEKQAITMLDNPVWESAPSFADVDAAYPAKGGGADGYAVDHCQVDRQGRFPAVRRRRRRLRTAASTGPPSPLRRSSGCRRSGRSPRITASSGSISRSASRRRARRRIVS